MVCIGENPVDNVEKTDYLKLTYVLILYLFIFEGQFNPFHFSLKIKGCFSPLTGL